MSLKKLFLALCASLLLNNETVYASLSNEEGDLNVLTEEKGFDYLLPDSRESFEVRSLYPVLMQDYEDKDLYPFSSDSFASFENEGDIFNPFGLSKDFSYEDHIEETTDFDYSVVKGATVVEGVLTAFDSWDYGNVMCVWNGSFSCCSDMETFDARGFSKAEFGHSVFYQCEKLQKIIVVNQTQRDILFSRLVADWAIEYASFKKRHDEMPDRRVDERIHLFNRKPWDIEWCIEPWPFYGFFKSKVRQFLQSDEKLYRLTDVSFRWKLTSLRF